VRTIAIYTFLLWASLQAYPAFTEENNKQVKPSKDEQIILIKEQLEFLALKLLKITKSEEHVVNHKGHELLVFGACGNGIKQGIKVNCVSPGSAAELMGIKSGDIITEVNGAKLDNLPIKATTTLYYNVIDALKDGDAIRVTYLQNGQLKNESGVIKGYYSPGYTFSVTVKPET
jgi:C-terminal processing protease CtpA/Prc